MLSSRQDVVTALQGLLQRGPKNFSASDEADLVSSGSSALDRGLGGGFRRGSLVEWLSTAGSGATTWAALVARRAWQEGQAIVIVDPERRFYPPAAAALGLNLVNLVVVCPRESRDYEWVLTQTLACRGVSAVLCWPRQLDDRAYRRVQLAAEAGRGLGLFVRSETTIAEPSWATVRLHLKSQEPQGRKGQGRSLRVNVLRSPGGDVPSIEVEIGQEGSLHDTHPLSAPAPLALATPHPRAPRA